MANPTTAKPSTNFAEWLSTASTVGELSKCTVPMMASGGMRDVVGNILGEPWIGISGHGTGHPPALVLGAFTFNGLSDPVYRFTAGTTGVRFPNRGWSSLSNNRTTWAVFKPVYTAGPIARTVAVWGSGVDARFEGIGLSISTAGVITVGRYYGSSGFTSSTVTLTSGKTYLVSITVVSTTLNLINVYCYDDQAYVTPSGTGTSFAVTSSTVTALPDACINQGGTFDGYGGCGFYGDMHSCGLSDATYDPATNAYFAD